MTKDKPAAFEPAPIPRGGWPNYLREWAVECDFADNLEAAQVLRTIALEMDKLQDLANQTGDKANG